MTVLTAVQDACLVIGIDRPSAVFVSSLREHFEMRALVNEIQRQIARRHDWNALKSLATITGDGVTASFARPADYDRMLKEGQIRSSARTGVPLTHITDTDIWLTYTLSGTTPDNPMWTMIGTSLNVYPILPNGEILRYYYIRSLPDFTADGDVFFLPENLLTLAIIWQWRANKGQPYAEDLTTFEIELEKQIKIDKGPGLLEVGSLEARTNQQFARPRDYVP